MCQIWASRLLIYQYLWPYYFFTPLSFLYFLPAPIKNPKLTKLNSQNKWKQKKKILSNGQLKCRLREVICCLNLILLTKIYITITNVFVPLLIHLSMSLCMCLCVYFSVCKSISPKEVEDVWKRCMCTYVIYREKDKKKQHKICFLIK